MHVSIATNGYINVSNYLHSYNVTLLVQKTIKDEFLF
jgi:hypothetical protein